MNAIDEPYLTTRELAELLRIKERKVYDMATHGDVPCVRVVGKLLFPRAEIMQWIDASRSGPQTAAEVSLPPTVLGSHDPLLDWALRESGSGLAAFLDGSADGLQRMAALEGVACATHIHEEDGWNVATVKSRFEHRNVVLVEFAQRVRGLIVAGDNPLQLSDMASLAGHRVARRQSSAASQQLFEQLLAEAGVADDAVSRFDDCARTEDELGMQVFDGHVDVAFGLQSVASRLRLGFLPQLEERFDLLVWRQAWFEPPFQALLRFMESDAFRDKAARLGGYDISNLGRVHFNAR
ncbi:substrate-binding domain-containing protein [Granulosicoccus sp. 3-233]|uniref:substrate-binding domain-containing protein n=1 Tax=Granulosicoccus sp. 3-233 TaxID=3417969 RepID=UPI003D33812B